MKNVLIVDDNPQNIYLLQTLLSGHGYQVTAAANGAEALEQAQGKCPEIIITDILMPVMDGFELCRVWKHDDRLKNVPFVFYTATYTDPKDEKFALELGAERFIIKPQEPEILLGIIEEIFEAHQAGIPAAPRESEIDESVYTREYNEALFRKLEKKMAQVEEANQRLEREIAERKHTEAERERLVTAIEQAAEMIVVTDAQACIQYVNPAFEKTTGYTHTEVLGKNPSILQSGKQDAAFYHKMWETISSGRTWHGRFINKKKDGSLYTEEATISPVRSATGAIADYVVVTRDVSRELDLEAQVISAQKMESVGRLAGGIAHDFNNLLTVILSYIGLMLDEAPKGDPHKVDLLEVKKAADRAAVLTRQLLAFSRKQIMQPVPLDLNQVVAGIEKMLRRILGEDIDFVQALAPDLGLTLADPGQIEQVLMNLAVNARDAMPEGGKLTIETANIDIDEEYTTRHMTVELGSYVQLVVTDSGRGMDEQTKAHLFEPFYTTKEKSTGTGLGLSTVYGIIKQSGGSISIYSELGKGTAVKVYLPRALSATTAETIKPSVFPTRATGTETILVVEDEEALREVAIRSLDSAGYTVLTAANGEEALVISAQHVGDIHLLLTDIVMPKMSGRLLAQELAKTRQTLKVVYMSGYTDDAVVHHGMLDAETHFLAKPFTSADLTRKVREVLDIGMADLADKPVQVTKTDAAREWPPMDKAALHALPPDVLTKLRKAVVAARYNAILKMIEAIRITEPNLAARLQQMADLFDYEGIREILSP